MDMILTTSHVHPRDRLAYWYDVACKVFVRHECLIDKPSAFNASIHQAPLGELGVIELDSTGLSSTTVTKHTIANQEDDVFILGLQLEGSATLIQDGREANVTPGDFVLLDAQRPFTSHYSHRWRRLFIKIPHRSLNARLAASSELTARPVRGSIGVGGLTSGFIRMIPDRVGVLQPAAKTQIAEQVLDLIALALASETGKDKPALSSGRAIALLQLRMAIESRLSDPTLDPSSAASAAGISVRYANVLLSQQGTSLQRLIVSRRLDHCRRALEDPAQAKRTITDIAFAWGFSDLSHFNRRFKAEYGCAPRDYRQRFRP
jgi:AraC family transcriptional regulator, positive regulator of tynA and feaB